MLLERIQLETDEVILKTVRKHWFVILGQFVGGFLMLFLPLLIFFPLIFLPSTLLGSWSDAMAGHADVITYLATGWIVLVIMGVCGTWTNYYLDLWIITDRRIIVVDQLGFFKRKVSMFRLERLQDIEFEISGIIPTLLHFGTIRAQTAGDSESNFTSHYLPDPRELQALIQEAMDARLRALHLTPGPGLH